MSAGERLTTESTASLSKPAREILIANTHDIRRGACDELLRQIDHRMLPGTIASIAAAGSTVTRCTNGCTTRRSKACVMPFPPKTKIAVASCVGSIEPLGAYASESRISSEEACRLLELELIVRRNSAVDFIIFENAHHAI